ncbi:MAG: nucleotidyltransferase family protein, partial [Oscillospiraceae bacterium]|nr:nucleotidyltransferase family protein [Oscillospiraceae bacterium]
MKTAGIIAEYNPFHNGHAYHIERTREAGAEAVICVMSGSFVQRGEPAVMTARARAQMALKNGADLVISLPLPWACAGAQT